MTQLVLALAVGILFACGAYLVMRRGQIKLILGLGLLSHGVNLLLFGSGKLTLGEPPIFTDKENYLVQLAQGGLADPLPQALILTAIVISFGITAFVIVLVNRRHTITNSDLVQGELVRLLLEGDPFATDLQENNSYDWLAYEVDEVYERGKMG
ncbi:MAG: Na+/H+ antiporter subunit C, partial [Caldilineaceae bacterium]|nr:Na+/H+ antiporter subunit C [Caldilineaceae bacterium]